MPSHKDNPLVSIAIPAYNHEKFIADTIESVISQHYENWELIVIDDGSTDNTPAIIDRFSGHEKIRIIHQENMGLSPTLNRALEEARGEFFGFLPSDDMFYREKLLVQVDFLQKHGELAGVGSFQTLIDENGRPLQDELMEKWFSYEPTSRADFLLKLLERNFVPAPSMLLRKSVVEKAGGFDETCRFMQDYDLWFRVLKEHEMKIIPRPLIYYRWHGGNQTYQATEETEAERGRVFEKAARLLDITDLYPQLWDSWRSELIALCRVDLFERLIKNPTPNFEEIQGIFDEKFAKLWRRRKRVGIPAGAVKDISPPFLLTDPKPAIMMEVCSLDTGGLEQVVHDLALALAQRDVPLVITCIDRGGITAKRLKEKGLRVEVLPLNNKEEAYRRILQDSNIRLVNSHYSSFGARIALEQAVPVVSTVHNIYAWLSGAITEGIRESDPLISHYVAVSNDVKQYLKKHFNIPGDKVSVIPNGLNLEEWEEKKQATRDMRQAAGISPDDFVFLCVASISRVKGQDRIVRALPAVLEKCPKAKVVLMGEKVDPSFAVFLEKLVRELDLEDSVIFREFEPDPSSWYFSSDAFVLPSIIEGWSISMLEAMFAGLPLIMTDIAGARTVVSREEVGMLIPSPAGTLSDIEGNFIEKYSMMDPDPSVYRLAEAMTEICMAREKWKNAGLAGRNLVTGMYNTKRQAESYETLFNRVMMGHSTRLAKSLNRRFHDSQKALEFSQRTLEKIYEQQRQGYWLHRLNEDLKSAWLEQERLQKEKMDIQDQLRNTEKRLSEEIKELNKELDTIYNSKGWKFLSRYRKIVKGMRRGN